MIRIETLNMELLFLTPANKKQIKANSVKHMGITKHRYLNVHSWISKFHVSGFSSFRLFSNKYRHFPAFDWFSNDVLILFF